MPADDPVSRCSQESTLDFFWFDARGASVAPFEDAVKALWAATNVDGRLWNPWTQANVIAGFKDRLVAAQAGELEPVDLVKEIVGATDEHIFEIRWDVNVTEKDLLGGKVFKTVQVRLYHSEPSNFIDSFVGLHAHEKEIDPTSEAETNRLQDAEIQVAVDLFYAGRPQRWGIP